MKKLSFHSHFRLIVEQLESWANDLKDQYKSDKHNTTFSSILLSGLLPDEMVSIHHGSATQGASLHSACTLLDAVQWPVPCVAHAIANIGFQSTMMH